MFSNLTKVDQMAPKEDKVERIQKKNSWGQGTIWRKKVDKDWPIHYEKTYVFAKKLSLNSMFRMS